MINFISHYNLISASVGILFSIALFFRRKDTKSNFYLSLLFFIISYFRFISFSIMKFSPLFKNILMHISTILVPFDILHPLLIFIYIKSITDKNFKLSTKFLIHTIPFFFFLFFYHMSRIPSPETFLFTDPQQYSLFSVITNHMKSAYLISINTLGLLYSILSIRIFLRFKKNMELSYSSINRIKTLWIYIFLILMLTNYLFRSTGLNSYILGSSDYNFYITMRALGDLCFGIIIVFTVFLTLYTPMDFYELQIVESKLSKIPYIANKSDEVSSTKYGKNIINEKKIYRIHKELLIYMKGQKPYLENSLTLKELSDNLNVPLHQLSLIINSKLNKNFHQFINTYRVEEAQKLIAESVRKEQDITLLSIAMNSGFNSKTSFNTFFKKSTGMTPSEYRNKIK